MTPTDVTSSVILKGLSAVAQRDASQSQTLGQNANAASGASTSNDQTQTADIAQNATASNSKDITVQAPKSTGGQLENFTVSVLVEDLLASAVGNIDQGQGGATLAANADGDTAEISREALEAEKTAVSDKASTTGSSGGNLQAPKPNTNPPLKDSRTSGVVPPASTEPVPVNASTDPLRNAETGSRKTPTAQPPVEPVDTKPGPAPVTDTRSSGIITKEETAVDSGKVTEKESKPEAVKDSRQVLGVPVSEDAEETGESEDSVEAGEAVETGGTEAEAATDTDESAETEDSSEGKTENSGKAEGDDSLPGEGAKTPADKTPASPPEEAVDPAKAGEVKPPKLDPDKQAPSPKDPKENSTVKAPKAPVAAIPQEGPPVKVDAPVKAPKEDPTKVSADEGTKEFNRSEEFAFDFGTPAGIFKEAFGDTFKKLQLTSPNGGIDRLEVRGTDLHNQVIGTKGGTSRVPVFMDLIA
ncbi:MAG: hypothetical protein O3B01_06300 [Planctomycetota bacterium]|nr:hypothetical protein [Planctomycetota bacterium]MDA1138175.1 hypothetical protein [Planctomycetota bacterium]